ncbi:hypothetical protein TNCV_727181, partial [Trichonephila clavipes]
MVDGGQVFCRVELHADRMQHIRSRCERVRLPDTLRSNDVRSAPPKEVFDNTFKRFKDFSHFFRKCKICGV